LAESGTITELRKSAKKELIVAKNPQTAVENSPVPFSPLTVPQIATMEITL
jgi:hypothetical protein